MDSAKRRLFIILIIAKRLCTLVVEVHGLFLCFKIQYWIIIKKWQNLAEKIVDYLKKCIEYFNLQYECHIV